MDYDMFVSLGGNCGAATQLKYRGLRTCAYPFDWLMMAGPETIDYLCEGFCDGFKQLCLKEHLRPMERPPARGGSARYWYEDVYTGFQFVHHFQSPITEPGVYEAARAILERRIRRLLEALNGGKRVLMILATPFAFDPQQAVRLLEVLRRQFPKSHIDLACLQFGVVFDTPRTIAEAWDSALPFVAGGRYAHPLELYACLMTGYEWHFLDTAGFSVGQRPLRGLDTWVFRLWRKTTKHLVRRGYPCVGVSLYRGGHKRQG